MQSPVKKIYITQVFGVNPDAYAKFGLKGHNGLDLRAFNPDGTRCYTSGKSPVYAPHGGKTIENAYDPKGYGNYIKIENDKEGSVLAHLDSRSPLAVGSNVSQGQLVGFQGSTGNSTGIHLHWGWYPIPRDRNNGYNGYVNQEGKYTPYKEETMSELHTYLGVTTDAEAKTKLKEHLGEANSKCNWGMTGDKGGYLGSERKKNQELTTKVFDLTNLNSQLQTQTLEQHAEIAKLKQDLADCEVETPEIDPAKWLENGLMVEVTEGNKKTTTNYKPA